MDSVLVFCCAFWK